MPVDLLLILQRRKSDIADTGSDVCQDFGIQGLGVNVPKETGFDRIEIRDFTLMNLRAQDDPSDQCIVDCIELGTPCQFDHA